jgi:hypothetical protein
MLQQFELLESALYGVLP